MDKLERSKTSFILFILIIIALILGGTYLLKNLNKEEKKTEEVSIKLDDSKDYFYNESNECLSVLIPICYPHVKINIDSEDARSLEKKLNEDMDNLDRSYEKITETDTTDMEIMYPYDDIFSARTINYVNYTSAYVFSLSVTSYKYYATGEFEDMESTSYNFDLKTGKLLSNEEVLKLYKLNEEKLVEKINKEKGNNFEELDSYTVLVDEKNNIIVNYVASENDIVYNDSITIYK